MPEITTAREFKEEYEGMIGHKIHDMYAVAVVATNRGYGDVPITDLNATIVVSSEAVD